MVDQITVPTFEQIETILSKLATNYSNLAIVFYDIFYNTTPMDVTFQMYDEAGILQTYTIPNRAKDMSNILSGNGSPQNEVGATKGVIYQDLENGDLYIKETTTGNTGWAKFLTDQELQDIIVEGVGSPEEVVTAVKGVLYVDRDNSALYIKTTDSGNAGWLLISANTENLANRTLDNLAPSGEAHFANPSLSNINSVGRALFDAKENTSNKVTSISASSTNIKFPTAKAVYNFVESSIANFADKDFSNITSVAEARFIGINKLNNGILQAPTIMYRGADNSFHLPAETILLCTVGLAEDNTINNERVEILQDTAAVIPTTTSTNGLEGYIFYDYTGNNTGTIRVPEKSKYFVSTTEPPVETGAIWFNPSTCVYHSPKTVDGIEVWGATIMAEIGRWSTNPDGTVKSFKPYKPMRLVDVNSPELEHIVIEVGGTEDNWYRLYKDGWIEAGGYGNGNSAITFNKSFRTANYTLVASGVTSYTKAAGGVTIVATGDFDWIAKGWI